MILRVKELWQRRTAIERMLGMKLPIEQADTLSEVGDIIWTAYIAYKIARDQKAVKLKLTGARSRKDKGWDKRLATFNRWASDAAEEEVRIDLPPVPISALAGVHISSEDLTHLREIGLIAPRGSNGT